MKHRWSTFLVSSPLHTRTPRATFPGDSSSLVQIPDQLLFHLLLYAGQASSRAHLILSRLVPAGCQSSRPTDRSTVTRRTCKLHRRTCKLHQLKSCDRTTCTSGRKPQQLPCPSAASCWHTGTSSDNAVPATLLLHLWALRRRGKLRRRRLRLLVLGVSHSGLVGHWCGSERRVRRVRSGKSRHA